MRTLLPLGKASEMVVVPPASCPCSLDSVGILDVQRCYSSIHVRLPENVCQHEHDISKQYLVRRPGWLWKLVCPAASSQQWLR